MTMANTKSRRQLYHMISLYTSNKMILMPVFADTLPFENQVSLIMDILSKMHIHASY